MSKPRFEVFWSDPDNEWVATASGQPFLSWLDKTPEKALAGLIKILTNQGATMEEIDTEELKSLLRDLTKILVWRGEDTWNAQKAKYDEGIRRIETAKLTKEYL